MNLRDRILRGGTYLLARQGLGMILSLVGVVLLTRAIGPEGYGLFAGPLGVYMFLFILSKWGIELYLIRREEEPQDQDYHQAFSLLLLSGLAGAVLASLALPLLSRWVSVEGFGLVALVLFAGLPVQLVGLVPMSRLERALDYRRVALIELSGQMIYYLAALPLAYGGLLGPWAPVAGWWATQLLVTGLSYQMTGYRPRIYWEMSRARDMLEYGFRYSVSVWVFELRRLVNPLVVGRYAGVEAVGYVALAIRVAETLSFAKATGWRVSIPTMGRIQRERGRLVSALTQGMQLQVLGVAPPLIGFGLLGAWLMPPLFGADWLPVLAVYPFIALTILVYSVFSLHSSVLYVLRRNREMTIFHLAHVVLFAGGAILLVPREGLIGYGLAEVVTFAALPIIHRYVVKEVGRPSYKLAVAWVTAFAPLLFWREIGWAAGLGMVGIALWPASWRALSGYAKDLRRVLGG